MMHSPYQMGFSNIREQSDVQDILLKIHRITASAENYAGKYFVKPNFKETDAFGTFS